MSQKTAKYLRTLPHSHADVRLYRLSEPADFRVMRFTVVTQPNQGAGIAEMPLEQTQYRTGGPVVTSSLSRSQSTGKPQTMIFAATENGQVCSWRQMVGSVFGEINPEKALRGLGYEPI